MAQANYTPIQLYRSTTASAVPTSGNLAAGELAINTNDGKLYYKDSGGTVQLIASKAGASGDVVGPASATDNAVVRFDGTTGKLVQNSVVTIADSTGDVAGVGALTASGNLTLSGGTANGVLYLNGSKVATSGSAVTYNGTTFATSADASISGLTVGKGAGAVATNTAVGASALNSNSTGAQNTAIGNQAGATTNAAYLTAVGYQAARYNTGDGNTAIGTNALLVSGGTNGTGTNNVAVGKDALYSNTTASSNTAIGYQAGYTNTIGQYNTFVGYQAGYSSNATYGNLFVGYRVGYVATGGGNTIVGSAGVAGADPAGLSLTTGTNNSFFGSGAGSQITTGGKNTLLGAYNGNQGGLDIRTANNNIVLSDGDGNPRAFALGVNWFFTSAVQVRDPNTGAGVITVGTSAVSGYENQYQYATFGGGVGGTEYGWQIGKANNSGSPVSDKGFYIYDIKNNRVDFDLDLNGNIKVYNSIALGNTAPSTSGTGITFPATQNASSNANTLDDYEEGTFTPSYVGSVSNPTVSYNQRNGRYVKIGQFVQVTIELETTSVSGGSGDLYVSGLPFTALNDRYVGNAYTGYAANWTTRCPRSGYILVNTSSIGLTSDTGATTQTNIGVGNLTTSGTSNYLIMTATYRAAS